jgi:RNA polymerase sigma-70 factor (ECF subfamily)
MPGEHVDKACRISVDPMTVPMIGHARSFWQSERRREAPNVCANRCDLLKSREIGNAVRARIARTAAAPKRGFYLSPPSPDLAKLIIAIGKGDHAAFEALYAATSPKLLALLVRLVPTRAIAEEILQDVYVRVWTNAGRYTPVEGAAFAWLASIARHRAIDVVRLKTPVTLAPNEDGSDWLDRITDPTNYEAKMLDGDALHFCLDKLEEQSRDLILLAYYEGYSREELATRYDKPVNTIKTWLHRGLAALTTCLKAHS